MGEPDAPVVIAAWEDFQCPVCKTANSTVLAQIIADYVETGQAQLYYRYFAFLGDESVWAAEAAECAAEQGKFWEYHDALYSNQAGENRGAFGKDNLRELAVDVGLDEAQFDQCFDSGKYAGVIDDELDEGRDLGVSGTPTFFVDGVPVLDWRDYESFAGLIETRLEAAR